MLSSRAMTMPADATIAAAHRAKWITSRMTFSRLDTEPGPRARIIVFRGFPAIERRTTARR
jgi:hypothetical protein